MTDLSQLQIPDVSEVVRDDKVDDLHVVEAPDAYGISKEMKVEDGRLIVRSTMDVEPLLEAAAEERAATAGQRWGEMRKIGTVPMHIYQQYMTIRDRVERQAFIMKWLRDNPAFQTFDRAFKTH